MNDWNIQSRAHGCETCGKPFADKQHYHTLLSDEKSEFKRIDVCPGCWEEQYSQGASDRKGFVSHWQGLYEVPPAAAPEAIQKENAESLLRKVIELNDPQFVPAAYILAVILERKRLLKIKEQFKRDGRRIFIYEQPKTGDLFTITDPDLQLNQLEDVQRDVAALLEHGFSTSGQGTPPAAPAGESSDAAEISSPANPDQPSEDRALVR
jgi:hypothetical protein